MNKATIFFLCFISLGFQFAFAQDPFMMISRHLVNFQNQKVQKLLTEKKDKYYQYSNLRPSYNAFVGEDSKLLTTTFKGFGSLSEWNLVLSYPVLLGSGNTKFLFLPRTGVLWKKFRFANPLIAYLDTSLDKTVFYVNNDLNKDYGSGFFSYGKTKLVATTLRINPELGISIDLDDENAFGITVGPVLDVLLGAKYKQKYIENNQKKKEVIRGNDNLNINPFQYGISAAIMTPWIEIYGAYFLNNFFRENYGPSVNLFELGLSFAFIK